MKLQLIQPLWLIVIILALLIPGCHPSRDKSPESTKLPEIEEAEQRQSHFRVLSVGEIGKWGQGMEVSNGQTGRAFALSINIDGTEEFDQDVNVWCESESKDLIKYSGWSRSERLLTFICVHSGSSLNSLRVGICIRPNLSESTSPEPVFRAVLDGRALERALANVQKALGSSGNWGRIKAADYLAAEEELVKEGVDIGKEGRIWSDAILPF